MLLEIDRGNEDHAHQLPHNGKDHLLIPILNVFGSNVDEFASNGPRACQRLYVICVLLKDVFGTHLRARDGVWPHVIDEEAKEDTLCRHCEEIIVFGIEGNAISEFCIARKDRVDKL